MEAKILLLLFTIVSLSLNLTHAGTEDEFSK